MSNNGKRHLSFTAAPPPPEDQPPVTFDIDGETFTCRRFVPGSVIVEHEARLASPMQHVSAAELLAMWGRILPTEVPEDLIAERDDKGRPLDDDGQVIPTEHERFLAFINDPDRRVDVQLIGEMLMGVVGQLAVRPTDAPSASSRSRRPTGATSAAKRVGKASTS